jgi:hypothetical protein
LILHGGDDLDLKRLGVDLTVIPYILTPVPLGELIEDRIMGDVNAPYPRIVGLVCLGSRLIAHKDHPCAAIF